MNMNEAKCCSPACEPAPKEQNITDDLLSLTRRVADLKYDFQHIERMLTGESLENPMKSPTSSGSMPRLHEVLIYLEQQIEQLEMIQGRLRSRI